jgi:hypothetical protein
MTNKMCLKEKLATAHRSRFTAEYSMKFRPDAPDNLICRAHHAAPYLALKRDKYGHVTTDLAPPPTDDLLLPPS